MRTIARTFLLGAALLGPSASPFLLAQQPAPMTTIDPALALAPGDVVVRLNQDGSWRPVKILVLDDSPDGTRIAHCLTYNSAKTKPSSVMLATLGVAVWHAPILASSFGNDWIKIASQPVTTSELAGFFEYLKQTNFPRYAEVTGQDPKAIVHAANEHYARGNESSEKGKRTEAIAEYTLAIELFPLFYEAIDNRAFAYMELGDYRSALADFENSLQVNPDGVAAYFSKGECLMRLGQLRRAEELFEAGIKRFPQNRSDFQKYLEIVRKLSAKQ